MLKLGDSYGVGGEQLVGTYFGYWEADGYHGLGEAGTLYLWHLTTRRVVQASYFEPSDPCYPPFGSPGRASGALAEFPGPPAGYLLTSTGVAAWRDDHCATTTSGPAEDIEALDSSTSQVVTLDTASTYGALANLQLQQCEAGCTPGTAVVAWTDNGVWHNSTIN